MILRILLLFLIVVASEAAAQGTNCPRAASAAERQICADPKLREADDELGRLFSTLRGEAPPAVRATLVAGQRAWLAARTCTGGCLADRIAARRDALRALAATASAADPGPDTTLAVWLEGRYRTLPVRGLGGLQSPAMVPGLMQAGVDVRLSAGTLCEGDACGEFGLIPRRLSKGSGRERLPALLGLPADTGAWLTMRDGRASVLLVAKPEGGLTALANACAPDGDTCGWVAQDWTPLTGHNLREVDLGKP